MSLTSERVLSEERSAIPLLTIKVNANLKQFHVYKNFQVLDIPIHRT